MPKFVAISGSLRHASSNTILLRAAIALAPPGIEIVLYGDVGNLPQFNPDVENDAPPIVEALHALLRSCDGIVIACPEYAHGVPGAFKNALDWVVGCTGLTGKPVALINASGRAVHAQAALAEIIVTMGWTIVTEASPTIPISGKDHTLATIIGKPELAQAIVAALSALARAVEAKALVD